MVLTACGRFGFDGGHGDGGADADADADAAHDSSVDAVGGNTDSVTFMPGETKEPITNNLITTRADGAERSCSSTPRETLL
ncbi:hypothetical protein BH11MYX2_BH11MYX2_05090 [soil metagenome]